MNFNELDICLIMGLYPKERASQIESDSIYGIQNAANVFQWNILDGIVGNGVTSIEVINSMYIGSYPKKYKKMYIPSYAFSLKNGIVGENIGFLNLPVIKEYIRYFTMKKSLKRWALSCKTNKVAIAYAATYPMLKALCYLKKLNPEIRTCLIVPDLPIYMNLSHSRTGVLHRIKNKIVDAEIVKPDSYVLLTEQMKHAIWGAEDKPVAIVEGMTSIQKISIENRHAVNETGYKYFLYTGTLNYQYGIMDLVKSFERADIGNMQLLICGEGEAQKEIQSHARKNSRIHFLGCCLHDRVVELQKNAYALINPRRNEGEYTKYSFPSKIMEYMSSGRPTIAYLLDGMPKEYKQFLICVDDGENGLKKAMEYVAQRGEEFCNSFGHAAQKFVMHEKNSQAQMRKVLKMFVEEQDEA